MSMHKQEFPLFKQASEFLGSLLKKSLINVNVECASTVTDQDTLLPTADQPMCLHIQEKDQCLLVRRMDQRLSAPTTLQ
ncbi:hypothetical protein BDFG_02158 [Blastomyces dermatitidis ATCC 26199]|nr:hypothetical protein BDFG_02158 [Blastomyces dermatitidis ATCC 26199]